MMARFLAAAATWLFGRLTERIHGRWRLRILFWQSLVRLAIALAAVAVVVPIVIQPTVRHVLALLASVELALGVKPARVPAVASEG